MTLLCCHCYRVTWLCTFTVTGWHKGVYLRCYDCIYTEWPKDALTHSLLQGDLKTYLRSHKIAAESFNERGMLLKFASDIAAGLQTMHESDFVHRSVMTRSYSWTVNPVSCSLACNRFSYKTKWRVQFRKLVVLHPACMIRRYKWRHLQHRQWVVMELDDIGLPVTTAADDVIDPLSEL